VAKPCDVLQFAKLVIATYEEEDTEVTQVIENMVARGGIEPPTRGFSEKKETYMKQHDLSRV